MWYRRRFDRAPNYSEVVNELASTWDERRALLQGYFEPDEQEREEGLKLPTEAYRSIARLCADGYVRVILTTNFDRLLERTLEAEGVSPVVIDTPDAVEGASPLEHAGCIVVKINGDDLDPRIKNTPEELTEYDERVSRLLDRIFGEYGLAVSGRSGTYDTALIDALKRAGSRRYMTYWKCVDSHPRLCILQRRRMVCLLDTGPDSFRNSRKSLSRGLFRILHVNSGERLFHGHR